MNNVEGSLWAYCDLPTKVPLERISDLSDDIRKTCFIIHQAGKTRVGMQLPMNGDHVPYDDILENLKQMTKVTPTIINSIPSFTNVPIDSTEAA